MSNIRLDLNPTAWRSEAPISGDDYQRQHKRRFTRAASLVIAGVVAAVMLGLVINMGVQ